MIKRCQPMSETWWFGQARHWPAPRARIALEGGKGCRSFWLSRFRWARGSEAVALSPELFELHGRIERLLGRIVRMSGSGSSLFTLYDERAEAEESAERIRKDLLLSAHAVEIAPKLSDGLAV